MGVRLTPPPIGTAFGAWTVVGHTDEMLPGNHSCVLCECWCCKERRLISVADLKSRRAKGCSKNKGTRHAIRKKCKGEEK